MCNCDFKSDKSLLENPTYENLCKKMGYCGSNCYNNIDFEDKCDIECNYLFRNLYKNIEKKNLNLIYNNGKKSRKKIYKKSKN